MSVGEAIDASLISFTNMHGNGLAQVVVGGRLLLNYSTLSGDIILPLTQPLTIDMIRLYCYNASPTDCSGDFNVLGR